MSQNIYLPHADSQASFCDLSYFDYGLHEKTWRKIVDQHPFNHKVRRVDVERQVSRFNVVLQGVHVSPVLLPGHH